MLYTYSRQAERTCTTSPLLCPSLAYSTSLPSLPPFSELQLAMLDSDLEGAVFAVLVAVLGLAQAYLFLHHQRLQARPFDLWTIYFTGHFVVATVLFCVWKIPSPLSYRHFAFQLLLECAWVEGMAVVVSM
jgi:hypothetical protein